MKKILAILLTAVLLFSLSACDNYAGEADKNSTPAQNGLSESTKITRDEAIDIALNEAGAQKSDVFDLEAELDYENGQKVWEIDFDYDKLEYSYDVNAKTGAITKTERERDN